MQPPSASPDVAIVGAGIIGCAVAFELVHRGASVTLVDPRGAGLGATQASAGVLAPYIEGHDNPALTELGARSLAMYDNFVGGVASESDQAVPYHRCGTLETRFDEDTARALQDHATRLRARDVRADWLDGRALRATEPHVSEEVRGGLLIPDHGFIGAEAMTRTLASIVTRRGAALVAAASVRISDAGSAVRIETTSGVFTARTAVLAAGSWSGAITIEGAAPAPVRPVRGQLLHLLWRGTPITRVLWTPRCYLVPWENGTLLVGATVEDAGFDERTTVAGVRDLLEAACEAVPHVWQAGLSSARVGLRPATPDELPIVGRSARIGGLIYATGHYRNGVLLAPLTARLVADLIAGELHDEALATMAPARFGNL